MFVPLSRRDLPRSLLVLAITLLAALYACGLFSPAHWSSLPAYRGDSLETLARIQLASEQNLGAWLGQPLQRLGAPFQVSWASYPQPDQLLIWLTGKLSASTGLAPAAHILVLFAYLTSALSFFLCSRALGHRPLWAGCAAVLFGLSHFALFRNFVHYSFTLTCLLPPALLLSFWIGASKRLRFTPVSVVFGALFALLTGGANPYWIFIICQFLTGALLYQLFTQRRRDNLLTGLVILAAIAASALAWNLPTVLALISSENTFTLSRSYAGSELYALKFVELFVPPTSHHFPLFADFGRYYGGSTSLRGETHSAYLGLVPALGFALTFATFFLRLLRARAGLRPCHAPWLLWLILFSAVGGIHAWLALTGFDYFRATNRYSILLVALSLLFLGSFLARNCWLTRRPGLATLIILAITALGLWDQIPPQLPKSARTGPSQKIAHDQAFAAFLEKTLPPRSSVFQLPAVAFPEQPPVVRMTDYAHFRPFLFTKTLRFSYGALAGTPEANWNRWIGTLPPGELVTSLQAAGFHGLHLNRSGFKDRAASLLASLQTLGCPVHTDASFGPDHVLVVLNPNARPASPDFSNPRLLRPWYRDTRPLRGQPELYATRGWLGYEQDDASTWRWAGRDAIATLNNPGAQPRPVRLQFQFASNKPGRLALIIDGRTFWQASCDTSLASTELSLTLRPGATDLLWRYSGPLDRPATGDNRRLGFKIQDLRALFAD
jgi:hypothetical protein